MSDKAWWEFPSHCIGEFCPITMKYRDVPTENLTTLLEDCYEQGSRYGALLVRAEICRRHPEWNPLIERGW